jgi:branched-chain amino acid transport system substrate-binding protein
MREYVAGQTDYAGVNGVYDFKAVPQRGLTVKNAVVTRWDAAADAWIVVSGLAGTPLQK